MRHAFLILLSLALAIVMSARVSSTVAQDSEEEKPVRLLPLDPQLGQVPYWPGSVSTAAVSPAPVVPESTGNIHEWTTLVFETYRNNNWDIYQASYGASDAAPLIATPYAEIQPDFNRGATRVAFASNQTGVFQIYTMNRDGSGLVQLTSSPAENVYPRWSPDGKQILFQSARDGQAEIYLMDADGGNLRRLTNHPAYDGMPAWSPDGEQILFVSNRGGLHQLWRMNLSNGEVTRLPTPHPSAYPAWSPNGKYIAYSGDSDGDGWLEVWLMEVADGSTRRLSNSHGFQNVDHYVRSWSPAGHGINFTGVHFIQYQGEWYWTYSEQLFYYSFYDSDSTFREGSTDWFLQWQTTDVTPPTVAFRPPFPELAPAVPTLFWLGQDSGGAGMGSYDVEVRQHGDSDWNRLIWDTTEISGTIDLPRGIPYEIRLRANDAGYNRSRWVHYPGTLTLYDWSAAGHVTDNGGAPLQGVLANSSPAPFLNNRSDAYGHYALYTASEDADYYILSWSKEGYGQPPATTFASEPQDIVANVVLPPADNVLPEGTFEGTSLPAAWHGSGTVPPTVSNAQRFTGDSALHMGQVTPTVTLDSLQSIVDPDLGISVSGVRLARQGLDGRIHIVWPGYTEEGGRDIYYVERSPEGNWSDPVNLYPAVGAGAALALEVDNDGGLHVLINDGGHIVYLEKPLDSPWSTPDTFDGDNGWLLYSDGKLHLMRMVRGIGNYSLHYHSRIPGTDTPWSQAQSVTLDGAAGPFHFLADGRGGLHFIFVPYWIGNTFYYWRKPPGGEWGQAPQRHKTSFHWQDLAAQVDDEGALHLIFWGSGSCNYMHRSPNGRWSEQELSALAGYMASARVLDFRAHNGLLHLITQRYKGTTPSYEILYSKRTPDGVWSTPQLIAEPIHYVSHAEAFVDAEGTTHLALRHEYEQNLRYIMINKQGDPTTFVDLADSSSLLYYEPLVLDGQLYLFASDERGLLKARHYNIAAGNSTISRTLTVSPGLYSPYLSLLYQVYGESASNGLQVRINDTELATLQNPTSEWQHASLDVSPWLGETITLTLEAAWEEGQTPIAAWVDDLTLGSAHPDLALTMNGATNALPGGEVTYNLLVRNQGGPEAVASELNLQLPAGLSFVSATPAPDVVGTTVVWQLGDLAGGEQVAISLTLAVKPNVSLLTSLTVEASVDSASEELQRYNNEVQKSLSVAYPAVLPVVRD